jgi:hypothetical protein
MGGAFHDFPWSVPSFDGSPGAQIRNSSSRCPDCSAVASHRGCLPRPDQVSSGADGLQYFGRTFGYLRRGGRSVCFSAKEFLASLIDSALVSIARRFSSSSFSTLIFSERSCVSCSCRSQSSSKSMPSKSNLRMACSLMFALVLWSGRFWMATHVRRQKAA